MKCRSGFFAAVMLFCLGLSVTKAQVAPAAVGGGSFVAVGGGVSGYESVYGQLHLAGGLIYADAHPQWRIGFEGEARFLRYHTAEDISETNYLGGLHVTILQRHHIDPYAKFLVGMGRITLPFGYAHGSFLALAPGAGIDYALNKTVSIRVIDFEYQHWEGFPYGTMNPYGISAGIRVRVTPIAWVPHGVHKRRVHY
jgi:hypothetical protein